MWSPWNISSLLNTSVSVYGRFNNGGHLVLTIASLILGRRGTRVAVLEPRANILNQFTSFLYYLIINNILPLID